MAHDTDRGCNKIAEWWQIEASGSDFKGSPVAAVSREVSGWRLVAWSRSN